MQKENWISRFLPWGFIFFAGTIWGLSFSLGKIAVEAGLAPLGITLFQTIVSAGLLFIVCLIRGRPLFAIISNIRFVLLIAMLGAVIPGPILYIATDHLQAGILAITIAFIPMMTYGISIPLGYEKFNPVRVMGLIMGVIAIMLISLPENSLPDPSAIPWVLFAMLSVIFYTAENIILAARSAADLGPIRLALGMNAVAMVIIAPVVFWMDAFAWPSLAMTEVDLALAGLGLISVLAYTMFIYAVSLYGPVFASQTGYIVTLTGVLWGIWIFGESHSIWVWAALAAMIVGLLLVKPNQAET